MTFPVTPGSEHAAPAERFGRELSRAMRERGIGRRRLSPLVGVGQTAIQYHRSGRTLPRHEFVLRYADVLAWPRLVELSRQARVKHCPVDGRQFVDETSGNRIFCSEDCQKVSTQMRSGRPTRQVAVRFERRAARLQAAIEAMCTACEPDGLCAQPDCPLRGVSPLPLRKV